MEFDDIEKILELVRQHDLAEFELEREGLKLRVRKASAAFPLPPSMPMHAPAVQVQAPLQAPLAGTFYRAPEPGAPAFVEVGQRVKKDQVLCIIEAMKLMNEITSEYDGE